MGDYRTNGSRPRRACSAARRAGGTRLSARPFLAHAHCPPGRRPRKPGRQATNVMRCLGKCRVPTVTFGSAAGPRASPSGAALLRTRGGALPTGGRASASVVSVRSVATTAALPRRPTIPSCGSSRRSRRRRGLRTLSSSNAPPTGSVRSMVGHLRTLRDARQPPTSSLGPAPLNRRPPFQP